MLPSPRTIRSISRSSIPAEQERAITFPNWLLENSGGGVLILRQSWRPSTSFRLGGAFSSLIVCLRGKSRIKHRALGCAALVFEPLRLCSNWLRRRVPRGAGHAALVAIAVVALDGVPRLVWAQDATWSPPAAGNDFNDAGNWDPIGVPTRTASFGLSTQTSPLVEADTSVDQIKFTSSATSSYTIGVGFVGPATLILNGLGVTNSSPDRQGFVIGSEGTLIFNGGTAGINTQYTNLGGAIVFNNNSSGGSADFQNESSGTITFNNISHAGTGEIDNNEGTATFNKKSQADSVKIFTGTTTTTGTVIFSGGSNADSAEIITSRGTIEFHEESSAGGATITTNTNFAVTNFFDTSSADHATINVTPGSVNFFDSSSAGAASIHVDGLGNVNFHNGSTAGTATMTAGDAGSNDDFTGGFIKFFDNSTADHATITAFVGSNIEFHDASSAGNATIIVGNPTTPSGAGDNGFLFFNDTATAGHANITINPGGDVDFSPIFPGCGCTGGTATAGDASITNNGITRFFQGSSADHATITTNDGGVNSFFGRSSGGQAAFITNAGGIVDVSGLGSFPDTGAPNDPSISGTTAGSIAGAGTYDLGSKQLTVGSNNSSTIVSGTIKDGGAAGGAGGSLVKVGTGTLTIDGAGTYTGGTTVSAGTLAVGDFAPPAAALSGGGPISVGSGGTLGGYGSVTGPTVNSGVIAAGSATPGSSSSPTGTFTIIGNLLNQGVIQLSSGGASATCSRFAAAMLAPV